MRIAEVAPMYEAVPPHRYGGTERVVSYLTEELVQRGHDVTLFASGDSRTRAHLAPTTERALRECFSLQELQELAIPLHMAMLGEVFQRADEFDIIHCHNDYWAFPFEALVQVPVVTTLHGRLDLRSLPAIYQRFPHVNVVSISYQQRAPLAPLRPRWVGTVYNAIPVAEFPFSATPGDYFLFLGRIAAEKRPDWAVEIARRTGIKLKVAAKVDPYDQEYYARDIQQLFDDPIVEFLGEVDEEQKRALLVDAYALLFPIDWPEPFGMVLIEALACGTPVLAMNRGSVPEIVRHDVSGLIGNSLDELGALAPMIGDLDRRACRREAERRFSSDIMADGYEQVYQHVIAEYEQQRQSIAIGMGTSRMPVAAIYDDDGTWYHSPST
jgi:glycosyltransferase involved in cell wall biosynthesis